MSDECAAIHTFPVSGVIDAPRVDVNVAIRASRYLVP
jgi:hypothetical protein